MIDLSQVGFSYRGAQVLHDIDFAMAKGQLVAILGPNGAGKSTLLRLIAGLEPTQSGKTRIFGFDPHTQARRELAKRTAYLAQNYSIAFSYRAIEIVLMGRYAHSSKALWAGSNDADTNLAIAALERCDVSELANRPFDELSGGEQRRVLIAQALCQESELLLLDEPTAGLDPRHARDLFAMLRNECDGGRAALVVTHDLNLSARYCDQILLLSNGERVALGPAKQVLESAAMRDAFRVDLHLGTMGDQNIPYAIPY